MTRAIAKRISRLEDRFRTAAGNQRGKLWVVCNYAWGLALEKKALQVDTERFQTSVPGVFAVGDINTYPGKKKLILSGFHEAALAAFAIQHHLYPQKKQFLQYTTTSPVMHQRLGVPD